MRPAVVLALVLLLAPFGLVALGFLELPLGARAAVKGGRIRMVGLVATPDGAKVIRTASESNEPGVAA